MFVHEPASKLMSKLHEHSVLTFHKILTSRRVLERESQTKADKTGQIHLRFSFFLCLNAMAYGHSSGLPPWKAPVMIAETRKLFFFFTVVNGVVLIKSTILLLANALHDTWVQVRNTIRLHA